MVRLGFDTTQWADLISKLDAGQDALAISLTDLQSEMANIASILGECLVLLTQIRDNTAP